MSVIYPKSPTEHDRRVGALRHVIDRVSLSRSQSAERGQGLTAIVLERAATVVLVLIVGVGSAIAASGGSLMIGSGPSETTLLGSIRLRLRRARDLSAHNTDTRAALCQRYSTHPDSNDTVFGDLRRAG